jgi:hypothetical protein
MWTEGDALTIFFVIVDLSLDKADQGFSPAGRRYVPAAGATLSVTIENIDDNKKVVRTATQPFSQDGSIWSLPILATDSIRGSPQMRLTLTEGAKVTRGIVKNILKIQSQANC